MKEAGKYSDPIVIRAHHLLCIQGFQGYGYTPDFEQHMGSFVVFLNSNPSFKLQIVAENDEICSHCPYEVDGLCEKDSQNEIVKVDNLVIERASLDINQINSIEDTIELINNNLNRNDLVEICFNCNWKDICLYFIEKTIKDI